MHHFRFVNHRFMYDILILINIGTGEHMSHTLIASKCVDRLFEGEDEIQAMRDGFEKDFIGEWRGIHCIDMLLTHSQEPRL